MGDEDGGRMGLLLDSSSNLTPRAGVVDLPDMVPMSAGGLQRDLTTPWDRDHLPCWPLPLLLCPALHLMPSLLLLDMEVV